jgi:hypothetical protein
MAHWIDAFEEFPNVFSKVVGTTATHGPLALGILLLCLLLLLVYTFRDFIGAHRNLRRGAGLVILALLLLTGAELIFFTTRAFVRAIAEMSDDKQSVTFQGGLRYKADIQKTDIKIHLDGIMSNGAVRGPVYVYDLPAKQIRFVSLTNFDQIEIIITNRPLYMVCVEGAGLRKGDRDRSYTTRFKIDLKLAYLPTDGIHSVDFYYEMQRDDTKRDFLRLHNIHGYDGAKIDVLVERDPDNCIDEEERSPQSQKSFEIVSAETPAKREALQNDLLNSLGISRANAQEASSDSDDVNAIALLASPDPDVVSKAKAIISRNPSKFAEQISALLIQAEPKNSQTIANGLNSLRLAIPNAYRLPNEAIGNVFDLTYRGTIEERRAATAYLLAPGILNDDIVELAERRFAAAREPGRRLVPDQYLLLAIAVRDIYYNSGVRYMIDYLGDYGKRDRVRDAIEKSLADYQRGIDIIEHVPQDSRVPFAKSYYGKALALESQAAVFFAEKQLGQNANNKKVAEFIFSQAKGGQMIPFSDEGRSQFVETIDSFFSLVSGHESQYLWPHHISQLKACQADQRYTCFQ